MQERLDRRGAGCAAVRHAAHAVGDDAEAAGMSTVKRAILEIGEPEGVLLRIARALMLRVTGRILMRRPG